MLSYNGKILNAILHLEAKLASYPFEGLETFDVNEFQGITYGFVEMDIRDAWWRVFHEKKQDVDATSMAFMANMPAITARQSLAKFLMILILIIAAAFQGKGIIMWVEYMKNP